MKRCIERPFRTRRLALAAWTSALLMAGQAGAVMELHVTDIAVSGGHVYGNAVVLPVGETVTIGSRFVETAAAEPRYGLGLSYFGYDDAVIGFASGDAVSTLYPDTCIPSFGCFGGVSNIRTSLFEAVAPPSSVSEIEGPVQVRVALFGQIYASYTSLTADLALDGVPGNPNGDAHFRLSFDGLSDGITEIEIGTGADLATRIFDDLANPSQASQNALVRVAVPEPGFASGIAAGATMIGIGRRSRRATRERRR